MQTERIIEYDFFFNNKPIFHPDKLNLGLM